MTKNHTTKIIYWGNMINCYFNKENSDGILLICNESHDNHTFDSSDIIFLITDFDDDINMRKFFKYVGSIKNNYKCSCLIFPILISNKSVKKSIPFTHIIPNKFNDSLDVGKFILEYVKSINDIFNLKEFIQLDEEDLIMTIENKKSILFSYGESNCNNNLITAGLNALNQANHLFNNETCNVKNVLLHITGSEKSLNCNSVVELSNIIGESIKYDDTLIYGASFDNSLENKIRVSIIIGM